MVTVRLAYNIEEQWKEAEELELQVMEMRKRVLGPEHPVTLTAMGNLAFTLQSQSRDQKALLLMRACFQVQNTFIGPYHPDIESSLETLNEWRRENKEIGL